MPFFFALQYSFKVNVIFFFCKYCKYLFFMFVCPTPLHQLGVLSEVEDMIKKLVDRELLGTLRIFNGNVCSTTWQKRRRSFCSQVDGDFTNKSCSRVPQIFDRWCLIWRNPSDGKLIISGGSQQFFISMIRLAGRRIERGIVKSLLKGGRLPNQKHLDNDLFCRQILWNCLL